MENTVTKRTMVIAPTHADFRHWLRAQEDIAERPLHREYKHATHDRDLWGLNPTQWRIVLLWYPSDNRPVTGERMRLFQEVDRLRMKYRDIIEIESIRI